MGKHYTSSQEYITFCTKAIRAGESNAEIATLLNIYRFDAAEFEKGKKILQKTVEAYHNSKDEKLQDSVAYMNYSEKFESLEDKYKLQRNDSKIVLKREPQSRTTLEIDAKYPIILESRLETIGRFYAALSESKNEPILTKLSRVLIDADIVAEGVAAHKEVTDLRFLYEQERKETQLSTETKHKTISQLETWMDDYLDMASIALRSKPQLIEALGVIVPS